jgi:outer membrane protein TolC
MTSRRICSSFALPFIACVALSQPATPSAFGADTGGSGAGSLTLEAALSDAHEHSPELARAQAAADEASARAFEAFSGYLPKLTASGMYLVGSKFLLFHFNGTSIEAPNPISIGTLDASLNLFDGFQTTQGYRAARLADSAAQHELANAQLKLDNAVRLRFYRALSAQLLAGVADQNVKTLQDHLAKTKSLLSHGATTKLDTLRVEVQLSEALPDQIQAHDNVVLTRRELAQAMGLEDDERPLTGTLPVPDAKRLPSDLKLDPGRRDDLAAAQDRAEAADRLHSASYSAWIPHLGFLAEYQAYNNVDKTLNNSSFAGAYTVGFNLSWTLFDGANIARMREAAASRTAAEKAAEAAALAAPVEFENWRRRFLSNVALYEARSRAIESATESVRLARISYEAGTRTNTDVLDTELDLFRARAGAVRAQLDSAEALINLELALGHKL